MVILGEGLITTPFFGKQLIKKMYLFCFSFENFGEKVYRFCHFSKKFLKFFQKFTKNIKTQFYLLFWQNPILPPFLGQTFFGLILKFPEHQNQYFRKKNGALRAPVVYVISLIFYCTDWIICKNRIIPDNTGTVCYSIF